VPHPRVPRRPAATRCYVRRGCRGTCRATPDLGRNATFNSAGSYAKDDQVRKALFLAAEPLHAQDAQDRQSRSSGDSYGDAGPCALRCVSVSSPDSVRYQKKFVYRWPRLSEMEWPTTAAREGSPASAG
jgi:hypothetical protein